MQEGVHRLYANVTLFQYKGLEHPWVLVPVGGGSWNQSIADSDAEGQL